MGKYGRDVSNMSVEAAANGVWLLYEHHEHLRYCVTLVVRTSSGRIVQPTKPSCFYTAKEAQDLLKGMRLVCLTLCTAPVLQVWYPEPQAAADVLTNQLEAEPGATEEGREVRPDE